MHLSGKKRHYPKVGFLALLLTMGWLSLYPNVAFGGELQSDLIYEYYFNYIRKMETFTSPDEITDRNITTILPSFAYSSGEDENTVRYRLSFSLTRDMEASDYSRAFDNQISFGSSQFSLSISMAVVNAEKADRQYFTLSNSTTYTQQTSLIYLSSDGSLLGTLGNTIADRTRTEKTYNNSYSLSFSTGSGEDSNVTVWHSATWNKESQQTVFTADYGLGDFSYTLNLIAISDTLDFRLNYWLFSGERGDAIRNENGVMTDVYLRLYQPTELPGEISISNSNVFSRKEETPYFDSNTKSAEYYFTMDNNTAYLVQIPLGQNNYAKYVLSVSSGNSTNAFDTFGGALYAPSYSLSKEFEVNIDSTDYLGNKIGRLGAVYTMKLDDSMSSVTTGHTLYGLTEGVSLVYAPPSISREKLTVSGAYSKRADSNRASFSDPYASSEDISGNLEFRPFKQVRLSTQHQRGVARDTRTIQERNSDSYGLSLSKSLDRFSFSTSYSLELDDTYDYEKDISEIAEHQSKNSYSTGFGFRNKRRNFSLKVGYSWDYSADPKLSIGRDVSLTADYTYELVNLTYSFSRRNTSLVNRIVGLPVDNTNSLSFTYRKPKTDNTVSVDYFVSNYSNVLPTGGLDEGITLKASLKGNLTF